MIKSSVAHSIGAPIKQSSQHALQADGVTPLAVAGETRLLLSRAEKQLALDALVVDDLDVAGTPFLIANDITVRPAKCQVRIQDSEIIHNEPTDETTTGSHAVRRAQIFTLRAPSSATVVWPGEYLELDIPPDLGDDRILALQPHTDTPISKHTKPAYIWPEPQILEAVGSKIRLVITSNEPKSIGRLEHLSQILPNTGVPSPTPSLTPTDQPSPVWPKCSPPFSSAVSIDPDNLLPDQSRLKFQQLLQEYNRIFDPIQATVNIGPVQQPQRSTRATNL